MSLADKNFKKIAKRILHNGFSNINENVRPKYADGTPAYTYFETQVFTEYDLERGEFPVLTLRPIAWKSAIKEILWIYQDQSNDLDLLKNKYGITWWDSWDIGDRTIGQRYGATVRRYNLMNKLLEDLQNQPYGRRHIINLYQYDDFNDSEGLYPCAMETQWSVRNGRLDLTLVQRSSDFPVASSINAIQYVALQLMVAKHCGFKLGRFCHYINNAHIYDRHIEQVEDMLKRESQKNFEDIRLILNTDKINFYEFTIDDFELIGYNPIKPNYKFELAI